MVMNISTANNWEMLRGMANCQQTEIHIRALIGLLNLSLVNAEGHVHRNGEYLHLGNVDR